MIKSIKPNVGEVIVVGKTANGKEIGYKHLGFHGFKEVAFKDGGQIPSTLKGRYTNVTQLIADVKAYISLTEIKAEERPKAKEKPKAEERPKAEEKPKAKEKKVTEKK